MNPRNPNWKSCAFNGFNQKQLLIHGGHSVGDLRSPELQRPQRPQALQQWGVDRHTLGKELPQAQEERRGRIARWVDVVVLVSQLGNIGFAAECQFLRLDMGSIKISHCELNLLHYGRYSASGIAEGLSAAPRHFKGLSLPSAVKGGLKLTRRDVWLLILHLFCSAEQKDCVADAFFPLFDRAAMALHGYYSFQVDKTSAHISKFYEYFLWALFLECHLTEIHILPLVIEVNSNPDNFGRLSDSCQVSFYVKVIFYHSNILEALMYTAL
ncbi:hypothetical protein RJ639_026908 [Escallonia herrerae]|uniref:Uncharacterized protein n=1 Tax=Escallonia herrerae TaxID=1293975 RepID=A0AA88X7S9_9ASTE|nr:hypothetical protein RJ639_026908 [Escallonia herrerae]